MIPAFPKPERQRKAPKPLRRSGPMKRKRARRLDRPGANPERLERLHHEMCEVRRIEYRPGYWRILTPRQAGCRGRLEAAHEGAPKPGLAMKSSDDVAITLCRKHHRERHNPPAGSFFGAMTPEDRLAWLHARGAESQSRMMGHGNRRG